MFDIDEIKLMIFWNGEMHYGIFRWHRLVRMIEEHSVVLVVCERFDETYTFMPKLWDVMVHSSRGFVEAIEKADRSNVHRFAFSSVDSIHIKVTEWVDV